MMEKNGLNFFKDKSVFVTGHTGFKGAWLCQILKNAGACVIGYALSPEHGCVYQLWGRSCVNSSFWYFGVIKMLPDFFDSLP